MAKAQTVHDLTAAEEGLRAFFQQQVSKMAKRRGLPHNHTILLEKGSDQLAVGSRTIRVGYKLLSSDPSSTLHRVVHLIEQREKNEAASARTAAVKPSIRSARSHISNALNSITLGTPNRELLEAALALVSEWEEKAK